jgi:NADP-dependent alcohol dehydrogenase
VLVLYGGGSIKKNGIYNQVMDALSNYEVVEMGGIPPNQENPTRKNYRKN